MSDDADLERVERMLQRTPAPEFVPATAAAAARRAALGEPAHVTRAPRSWRLPAWWRVASPAAAFGAAVAVGGRARDRRPRRRPLDPVLALAERPAAARRRRSTSAMPADGVRTMVVHVTGCARPAAGHYYEMWFRTNGNENVSAVTFDTAASGGATFKARHPGEDDLAQLLGDARGDPRRQVGEGALHLAVVEIRLFRRPTAWS